MKKYISIVWFSFIVVLSCNAQIFKYNSCRISNFAIDPLSEGSNSEQCAICALKLYVLDIWDENYLLLKREQEEEYPNDSIIKQLQQRIKEQENDELYKENKIGKQEFMPCYVEYIVDSDNKLKIIGKTSTGDVLFEFGKGHNQELIIQDDEKHHSCIYLDIFNHDGGSRIAQIMQSSTICDVFVGDIAQNTGTEAIRLSIYKIGENKAVASENDDTYEILKRKLLQIFPKDEDGDRWMLCE